MHMFGCNIEMNASNLQIGLNKDNQLVSIFDVETGEKCNCTCPECGDKLIAKNRNKKFNEPLKKGQKIAHFSHANGADCPSAQETAVHLLAKQVLSKNKRIELYECQSCEFHKRIIYGDYYEKKIVCGFRMKLKNTTANNWTDCMLGDE